MATARPFNVAQAFSAFSKKLSRSSQASDGEKLSVFHEDAVLQKKVSLADESYRLSVISAYKKYMNPYKALGKNSAEAKALAVDEENLLKAYNVFKAVLEANKTQGDGETFVELSEVKSPLTAKPCYTDGGQFIYMQCWLIFEQGIKDYIPELVLKNQGVDSTWHLEFTPLKTYRFDYQDKEVMAIIEQCYHAK
jgi:hypothetical protein